ncbi:MAG: hypothetical protein KDA37_18635, partial [Planctomycetales bacterium]|nr:hypothetical protein [Planctomycetales bacterium]
MPGPGKTTPGTRGEGFLDIHLNATTRWKDVPEDVWKYTLGGYQVLKKWLSYREASLLGRALTADEARDFTHNVRRIAAILALSPELDAHYRTCAGGSPTKPRTTPYGSTAPTGRVSPAEERINLGQSPKQIRTPLQGSCCLTHPRPRALPWARLGCPFGAE